MTFYIKYAPMSHVYKLDNFVNEEYPERVLLVSQLKKICYFKTNPFGEDLLERLKKNDLITLVERDENNEFTKVIDSFYGKEVLLPCDDTALVNYLDELAKNVHFDTATREYGGGFFEKKKNYSHEYNKSLSREYKFSSVEVQEIIRDYHSKDNGGYKTDSLYLLSNRYIWNCGRVLFITELTKYALDYIKQYNKSPESDVIITAIEIKELDRKGIGNGNV